MKITFLALWFAAASSAATPALIYTKVFPGSQPEFVFVSIDRAGALEYKESPKDEHPVTAQLPDLEVSEFFSLAEKLNYFRSPLESGLKVANTGKKTFSYLDPDGKRTDVTFNYSTEENAAKLLDHFEQVAASERAYIDLDRTAHFDKLGVNDALAAIESLWLHKQLTAPAQFIPLLNRIATHESYMHLARDRAARLRDEFAVPPPAGDSGKSK